MKNIKNNQTMAVSLGAVLEESASELTQGGGGFRYEGCGRRLPPS